MRATRQLSVTLLSKMAQAVKGKVRSGDCASESEGIRDGLRARMARDGAVEYWLHAQAGPAYGALKADPKRSLSADRVRARLAAAKNDGRRAIDASRRVQAGDHPHD